MRRFRELERQLKIRTFSKTGLEQDWNANPEEVAKEECSTWLCDRINDVRLRMETLEADVEELAMQGELDQCVPASPMI